MSTIASPPKPRGPAADPSYPSSHSPDNPYKFPEKLLEAASLPPKQTDQAIYFFGYENTESNQSPYVVFQQWFPASFVGLRDPYGPTRGAESGRTEMVTFPTSEHFMMYHKAMLMGDKVVGDQILASENAHPSRAKLLGRQVRSFDEELWKAECQRVVEEGNYAKFGQRGNEDLKAVLLSTGNKLIVEASPDDKIWGIGFNSNDAEGKEDEWGMNLLGKCLMKVRDRLRKEDGTAGVK